MKETSSSIAAVVLAAGQSRRMGRAKLVLPWGGTTVIGKVVATLQAAGVEEICVVTGGAHDQVAAALQGSPVRLVFNEHYASSEMMVSLQLGLAGMGETAHAALVALGDQPQIELEVVQDLISRFHLRRPGLLIPSYQMRRGHPWLVERHLWPALLSLGAGESSRDFLNAHTAEIEYMNVDTPSVLLDLDTPEDYRRFQPSKRLTDE